MFQLDIFAVSCIKNSLLRKTATVLGGMKIQGGRMFGYL